MKNKQITAIIIIIAIILCSSKLAGKIKTTPPKIDPPKIEDPTDPTTPGENPGGTDDPTTPGENPGGTDEPTTPGENPGGTDDPTTPGENPGGTDDPTTPGENPGGTDEPTTPGTNPGTNPGGTSPDNYEYMHDRNDSPELNLSDYGISGKSTKAPNTNDEEQYIDDYYFDDEFYRCNVESINIRLNIFSDVQEVVIYEGSNSNTNEHYFYGYYENNIQEDENFKFIEKNEKYNHFNKLEDFFELNLFEVENVSPAELLKINAYGNFILNLKSIYDRFNINDYYIQLYAFCLPTEDYENEVFDNISLYEINKTITHTGDGNSFKVEFEINENTKVIGDDPDTSIVVVNLFDNIDINSEQRYSVGIVLRLMNVETKQYTYIFLKWVDNIQAEEFIIPTSSEEGEE